MEPTVKDIQGQKGLAECLLAAYTLQEGRWTYVKETNRNIKEIQQSLMLKMRARVMHSINQS